MEWELPPLLDEEDLEEVIDMLSAPPAYVERIAPLSFHLGAEVIAGKNPSEALAKFLRQYQRMLQMVSGVVRQVSRDKFGERGPVAFMGLSLCPETIRRLIEFDYENADNTYSRFVDLIRRGDICPVATIPFHVLVPAVGEWEVRFLIRLALEYYWPLLTLYNRSVVKRLQEDMFCMVFHLPEGGFTRQMMEILHTEFVAKCEQNKIEKSHLILLLETGQVREREADVLMKRWHSIRPTASTRDYLSIMFRDRTFTQWVVEGHPSVKKMLDRTIAKVDAFLRDTGIDYPWSHFEPIESLLATHKTAINFQQKLIKLTELGYQPLSPDAFVRRKLLNTYKREDQEPRRCSPLDNTVWNGWEDDPTSMSRFEGILRDEMGQPAGAAKARKFMRHDGRSESIAEKGPQVWKPALWAALRACHKAIVGEPRTFLGGMLQVLRELVPIERIPIQRRNVEDFLVRYARIHWREHFIQTIFSEADIQLSEFVEECLKAGCPDDAEIDERSVCVAGAAARAVFLAYEALRSTTFSPENFDQRGTYEATAMMTLAFLHAAQAHIWAERREEAEALLDVLRVELFEFENAFDRHNLQSFGFTKKDWKDAIKSHIEDTELNVVARASRRVAAQHMRRLGFRKQVVPEDRFLPSAIGHLWSSEVDHSNYRWENTAFCGLAEE